MPSARFDVPVPLEQRVLRPLGVLRTRCSMPFAAGLCAPSAFLRAARPLHVGLSSRRSCARSSAPPEGT